MLIKTARRAIVLACAASAFFLAAGATTAHADKTKRHVKKDNNIGLSITSEKTNDTGSNTSIHFEEEDNINGKIVRSETWAETTRTISIDGQNYLLVTCQGCSKQSLEWIVESKKNFSSLPVAVEVEDAETDIKGADVILQRSQTNYIPPCVGNYSLGTGSPSSF